MDSGTSVARKKSFAHTEDSIYKNLYKYIEGKKIGFWAGCMFDFKYSTVQQSWCKWYCVFGPWEMSYGNKQ